MLLGLNCDPLHWEPDELADHLAGTSCAFIVFPWLRSRRDEYAPYGTALEKVHVEPIPVLTADSLDEPTVADQVFPQAIQSIVASLPTAKHVVLGNEEDADLLIDENGNIVPSPRSWRMTIPAFRQLLKAGRDTLPSTLVRVAGGTVSGQPRWWTDVRYRYGSARHAHLYTQDHVTVRNVLKAHRDAGCPITWSLEFGWPMGQFATEHDRAVEMSQFLVALAEEGVEFAAPFRFSDRGDPAEQFGLLDENDAPRESLAAFRDAALNLR